MKYILSTLMVLMLTNCGFIDTVKTDSPTTYTIASCSHASGIIKLFKGESSVAKISRHGGDTESEYSVTLSNKDCNIEAVSL